ncbi:MAG: PQQ-binding-like beta-propeller repeat protein [Alphaproteobacteria bacterium]|nr:PQQ-binding-like beta-propeller repeat protein [Alphaproteobacteria bacterium]
MWGQGTSRNMVSTEKKAPKGFDPGAFQPGTETVDLSTTDGVKWVAKLGSQAYGNVTVAGGKVFVGTNNALERRPDLSGDYSVVLAFDEASGDFLWQLTVPKLGSGKVNDWEFLGVCSSPQVVGDVAYVVTNRGEVVALDVDGLKDGNDGFTDEAEYMVAPGMPEPTLDPAIDADILWVYDMPNELGVFPHNVTSSSVLVVGDKLFVTTSNGTDWSHLDLPSPFSPALIVLDRNTGALVAEEDSAISEHTMHSNWSTPMLVPATKDVPQEVIFGGGDGFLHAFDVDPVDDDGLSVLHERWRVDGNKPEYRAKDGVPVKYATPPGPSEFIATPVYAEGLIYAAIGQDPEHGVGVGQLTAVKPDGTVVWRFDGIGRSISTPAVYKGVVYTADYGGHLYAVDAKTGALLWDHDCGAHIWGSPYVAGKYVYVGDEDGILHVLKTGKKYAVVDQIALTAPIYGTPVLANGVLYVQTQTHLYAVDGK